MLTVVLRERSAKLEQDRGTFSEVHVAAATDTDHDIGIELGERLDEVSRRFDVLDLHIEFRTPKLVHAELRVGSAVFQKQYADRHGLRPQAYRLRARGGDAGNVRLSDELLTSAPPPA